MLEEHPFELCVSPFWTGLSRVNTVYFLDQIKTPMLDNNPHSFRHIFGEETPSPFPSQSSPCGLTRVRHLTHRPAAGNEFVEGVLRSRGYAQNKDRELASELHSTPSHPNSASGTVATGGSRRLGVRKDRAQGPS